MLDGTEREISLGDKKNVKKENGGMITMSTVHPGSLVQTCRGRDATEALVSVERQESLFFQTASNNTIAPFELYTDTEKALCFFTVLGQANSQITSRVTLSVSGITMCRFLESRKPCWPTSTGGLLLVFVSELLSACSLFVSLPFFSFHLWLKKEGGDKRKGGDLKEVEQC